MWREVFKKWKVNLTVLWIVIGIIGAMAYAQSSSFFLKGKTGGGQRGFAALVDLGRDLFFDPRLSKGKKTSCASCHIPTHGFSDPRSLSVRADGSVGRRNAPTLINVATSQFLFWDGRSSSLEDQALKAFDEELGMPLGALIKRLQEIPEYSEEFENIFRTNVDGNGIGMALAAFERTIIVTGSPFDQFMAGDQNALSPEARLGFRIFRKKGRCKACHELPNFTDRQFHNIGVPSGDLKTQDLGRYEVTGAEEDRGAFKTPILRNIAQTAPYMHNGVFKTLEEVVEFYVKGGEPNPNLSTMMAPVDLKPEEKMALVEFLQSLTGNLSANLKIEGETREKKNPEG